MQVVESLAEWRRVRPGITGSVALVPTMGYLHEGHVSLVRRARAENDAVIVWIFVNPKQFGAGEDFESYPRDPERDLALLRAEGVDWVLAPTVDEVYPPQFQTTVAVSQVSQPLEGARRPGHFTGVTTIVAKMFCLTRPDRAYFGQKDAQQCIVVRRMVADLGMLLEVVVCPTVREADGLALSSRNAYLTPEERQAAPVLYRALQAAAQAVTAGERDAAYLREVMQVVLGAEPLAAVEYVSVADRESLEELTTLDRPAVASLAVQMGRARLIDNVLLEPAAP